MIWTMFAVKPIGHLAPMTLISIVCCESAGAPGALQLTGSRP